MSLNLSEKLKSCARRDVLPMHMPGHKRNLEKFPWLRVLSGDMDITEIEGFDNLNDPEGILLRLNERLAVLRGADRSFALVNGSTGGILAAVKLALPCGGKVLVSRGSHRSVYSAAELMGAELRYLVPPVSDPFCAWGAVTPESVESALDREPDIGLAVITSPTYEGVISDIRAIAEVCHAHGVPLLVDAAHGAHLGFGGFPEGAVSLGADMAVESLHKTLPSPTQTAVLSIKSDLIDSGEAQRAVSLFQTSSPSYLLLAGIDGCAGFMETRGETEGREWLENLQNVRGRLKKLRNMRLLETERYDPSKLVLSCYNGYAAMELFREAGVELEMASERYVIAMTGMGDTAASLERFCAAAETVDKAVLPAMEGRAAYSLPERVMSVSEALRRDSEPVPLSECEGRVCAEFLWAYPPGSPVLVPGEAVSKELLNGCGRLRSSFGAFPESLRCVKPEKDLSGT